MDGGMRLEYSAQERWLFKGLGGEIVLVSDYSSLVYI